LEALPGDVLQRLDVFQSEDLRRTPASFDGLELRRNRLRITEARRSPIADRLRRGICASRSPSAESSLAAFSPSAFRSPPASAPRRGHLRAALALACICRAIES